MRIGIVAWTAWGTHDCGHPYDRGDLCYVLFPVVGMSAHTTVCSDCGALYVAAIQRLARLPSGERHRASLKANLGAEAARHRGMLASAQVWLETAQAAEM